MLACDFWIIISKNVTIFQEVLEKCIDPSLALLGWSQLCWNCWFSADLRLWRTNKGRCIETLRGHNQHPVTWAMLGAGWSVSWWVNGCDANTKFSDCCNLVGWHGLTHEQGLVYSRAYAWVCWFMVPIDLRDAQTKWQQPTHHIGFKGETGVANEGKKVL